MSARSDVANKIFWDLHNTGQFLGPVNLEPSLQTARNGGKYYSMLLMIPRVLDLRIDVYGVNRIRVDGRGGRADNIRQTMFESAEDTINYIKKNVLFMDD